MENIKDYISDKIERLRKESEVKPINPVKEIVRTYYKLIGKEAELQEFYKGRYGYAKLAKEAKELLTACGDNLEDALWALSKMCYKADKGGFDWTIRTCLKHNLK